MTHTEPKNQAHTYATIYAEHGLHVLPITPGQKHPPFNQWQKRATTNQTTINKWWTTQYPNHGVGIATGPKSGCWVLDIDINDNKPGADTYDQLIATYGPLPQTLRSVTGSGGFHIFFKWDPKQPITNGASQNLKHHLGIDNTGIDIRGEGGQVVVAPTTHPQSGNEYFWADPPGETELADAPQWLYQLLTPPPTNTTPTTQTTPNTTGDQITQWVAQNHDYPTILQQDGWTQHHTQGNDTYWTRPGKNPRDGHSAVLHHNTNILVVFTTETPPAIAGKGARTTDGSGESFNLYTYLTHTRHNSDTKALARQYHQHHNPHPTPTDNSHMATTGLITPPTPTPTQTLELPDHIFTRTPIRQQIADITSDRGQNRTAVLIAALARIASLTPPQIKTPAINAQNQGRGASPGSLNLLVALIGPSGTGKSQALHDAATVLNVQPHHEPDGYFRDGNPASGEGYAKLFRREIEQTTTNNPNANTVATKTETQNVIRPNVYVQVAEGVELTSRLKRDGSTLLPMLLKAVVGESLSTQTVTENTERSVPAGTYSTGVVLAIQPTLAADIVEAGHSGFTQRFIFCPITTERIDTTQIDLDTLFQAQHQGNAGNRTHQPEHNWKPPHRNLELYHSPYSFKRVYWYLNDLQAAQDPLDAHKGLLIHKIACLLTLLDNPGANGTLEITPEVWDDAETIVELSTRIRAQIVAEIELRKIEAQEKHAAAQAHNDARRRALEEDLEDIAHAKKVERICVKVADAGPDGTTRRAIGQMWNSKTREAGNAALDHAISSGRLVEEDGRLKLGDVT